MKKNIFQKFLILLAIITLSNACTDSFLEVDKRGLTDEADFYKTDDQALAAVVSAYDMLQSMYAKDWTSAWFLKVTPGGEISNPDDDQPHYYELMTFTHTAENSVISAVFREIYFGIYRANKVLERVEPDSDVKTIVRAEAKFLRALYYFDLVTLWGEVPLVTTVLAGGEYAQPKNSVTEIWAQIESDLSEASQDLLLRSEMISRFGNAHLFRATKGAAQALLGKAYLFQEKYDLASAQFESVIASGEYDLVDDFSTILKKETEFGIESLFEISYSTEEGHTWANGTFPWGNGRRQENMIHWQLAGPRGDGYFNGGTTGLINGWGFAYPTQSIYDAFKAEDLVRRQASIMSEAELIAKGGSMRFNGELHRANPGFIRLKYGTWLSETNEATQAELNYGTNIRLIRYADVLLMAAEAYHKSSQYTDAQALTELNKVRVRADLTPLSEFSIAMEDIRYERTAELAFEGHRFLDLVRWGLASEVLGAKGYQARHRYLPIPQFELDINPNLEQNPDWK